MLEWVWAQGDEFSELRDVLPNEATALSDWSDLVKESRVSARVSVELDGEYGLLEQLSDEETSRMRYARTYEQKGKFALLGPRWGRGLQLCYDSSPHRAVYDQVFDELDLWNYRTSGALKATLKGLDGVFKKHGELLTGKGLAWKDMTNLQNVGGYVKPADPDELVEQLRLWVGEERVHQSPTKTGEMSTDQYLRDFRMGIREFFRLAPNVDKANERSVDIGTWSEQPGRWIKAGSSTEANRLNYDDRKSKTGRQHRVQKSKNNAGAMLSSAVVRERVMAGGRRQAMRLLEKREMAKSRSVVASEDTVYLKMSFVDDWIQEALRGHPSSTLWKSTQQMVDMWVDLARATETDSIKMPLDQSHFDWQVTKPMLSVWFEEVALWLRKSDRGRGASERLRVLGELKKMLVDIPYYVDVLVAAVKVWVENGLLSGWKWTSLIGTSCNFGILWAMRVMLARLGCPNEVIEAICTGDDDKLTMRTWGGAAALVMCYGIANFDVNPRKFFVDTVRDEFLRQVSSPGETSGYLPRAVGSVLWRNPISRDPPAGVLRAQEQMKQWNLILGRGGDREAVISMMLEDISRANGLSKDEVKRLLETPSCMGGLGLWANYRDPSRWLALKPGAIERSVRLKGHQIVGGREEQKRWQALGALFGDTQFEKAWEKRLEFPDAQYDVVPGKTYQPARVELRGKKSIHLYSGGWTTAAYANRDHPTTFAGDVLDAALNAKPPMYDWIQDVWVADDIKDQSVAIRRCGGTPVWRKWLQGKLPFRTPVVEGWSDLMPSVYSKGYAKSFWRWLNSGGVRYNAADLRKAALRVEELARALTLEQPIRLGG